MPKLSVGVENLKAALQELKSIAELDLDFEATQENLIAFLQKYNITLFFTATNHDLVAIRSGVDQNIQYTTAPHLYEKFTYHNTLGFDSEIEHEKSELVARIFEYIDNELINSNLNSEELAHNDIVIVVTKDVVGTDDLAPEDDLAFRSANDDDDDDSGEFDSEEGTLLDDMELNVSDPDAIFRAFVAQEQVGAIAFIDEGKANRHIRFSGSGFAISIRADPGASIGTGYTFVPKMWTANELGEFDEIDVSEHEGTDLEEIIESLIELIPEMEDDEDGEEE